MNSIEQNLYFYAEQYIIDNFQVNQPFLDIYLKPNHDYRSLNLRQLYEHFLIHAKNKSTGGNAIENIFGTPDINNKQKNKRWDILRTLLHDFNPHEVAKTYPTIFEFFPKLRSSDFVPITKNDAIVHNPSMFVYLYCLSIVESAIFLDRFQNGDAFYDWADTVKINPLGILAELQHISGIGEALSRDLLKELGYTQFVKPDVHTIAIAKELNIVPSDATDIDVAQALQDVAVKCGKTPYALDRLLWLIGSGNFFDLPKHNDEQKQLAQSARKKHKSTDHVRDKFIKYVLLEENTT